MSLGWASFQQNILGVVSRKVGRNRRQISVHLRGQVTCFSLLVS